MDEAARRIQELEAEVARLRSGMDTGPEGLLRALMEQATDHVYFKDLQSRFILANQVVAQAFRLRHPDELRGRSDFDFFTEAHARQAYEDEQEIINTGLPRIAMEEMETWPDGTNTWVSTTKAPLRDGQGAIIGTFGISRNITNHKKADTELRVSEAKHRMVFDHAVDGILMGSPEGLIIDANAAACDLVDLPRQELLGLHISQVFAPESLAAMPLRFDLLRAGQRVVSERELLRHDGSRAPVEMHTKMMPDGSFQAIVRDVSERREAEASYRGLFDSVMEAVYLLGRDGRFLDVNRGAQEMYQRPRDFFIGRTPEVLSAPGFNDLGRVHELIERAFAGEPQCFEFWGVRANGEIFPKEVRVYMGTYFRQDVVIALSQDISQRKRAEQALQASERHYRELLEGLQEGFAFTDTEERFVFANPAASAIFGTPEGLAGHHLREFLDPEVFAEVLRKTEARRQGVNGQYELPIRRPDAEARIIALSVNPWLDEAGTYLGSRGLFQDVTERKRAEQALRESETNFRSLLEKLGEGFAIVDAEERWTFANPAAARIFGTRPEDMVGRSIPAFVYEGSY